VKSKLLCCEREAASGDGAVMEIFLYEYTCAALAPAQLPTSLAVEGKATLQAVAQHLVRAPGIQVVTLLHEEFGPELDLPYCRAVRGKYEEDNVRALAGTADGTLIIAPEFNDILGTRCRWVLEAGGRLLGPSPAAVQLTADKLALCRHLGKRGVPTPCSHLSTNHVAILALDYPVVFKPRFGAGSQATVLVRNPAELEKCSAILNRELPGNEAIVQPFVPGKPVSVAFLIGPHQVVPLLPAAQKLSADGRFRYQGGAVPLPQELAARAISLGQRAIAAVPGLRGYVGLDLVLGPASNGCDDMVIEINPRLTTSYLGQRVLARTNLALAMVRIARGDEAKPLEWHQESVEFTAAGNITRSSLS